MIANGTVDMANDLSVPLPSRIAITQPTNLISEAPLQDFSVMYALNASDHHQFNLMKSAGILKVYTPTAWLLFLIVFTLNRLYMHLYHTTLVRSVPLRHNGKLLSAFPTLTITVLLIALLLNLFRNGLLGQLVMEYPSTAWFNNLPELLQLISIDQAKLIAPSSAGILEPLTKERTSFGFPPFDITLSSNMTYIKSLMANGPYVYLSWTQEIETSFTECGFQSKRLVFESSEHELKRGGVLLLSKNLMDSDVPSKINKAIKTAGSTIAGMVKRYNQQAQITMRAFQESCEDTKSSWQKSIALIDVLGVYALFALGVFFAAIAFIFEVVISHFEHKQTREVIYRV